MYKKNVLDELSHSLSEKERTTLLDRINSSLNTQTVDNNEIPAAESEDSIEGHINEDLHLMSWFRRTILFIRSKLSGRKITDILIDRRIKQVKKYINKKQPGITGFESRNLTPQFAEEVFNIYSRTFAFRELYRKLWMEAGVFESSLLYIIRGMYEQCKNELEDFISMDELVQLYAATGRKDFIREEAERRIDEYITSIPELLYNDIDNSLKPLYRLKDLILFPYTAFFQKFSFTPNRSGEDGGKHFFKNASVMLCLDDLRLLYKAVNRGAELNETYRINRYLIEFLRSFEGSEIWPEENQDELKEFILSIKAFNRKMPILELLRFFLKDPYLKINYVDVEQPFKMIYREILRKKAREKLEEIYTEIQKEYIEKEIGRIFKGKRFIEFCNYRKYAAIDYQKMGLPFFTHTKSLNLLYNYVVSFYQGHLSEVVSILEKGILAQNRITRDRLLNHSIALQDLESKIKASDDSLAPEEEDGKIFHKLRISLISEPSQQRIYRTMVVHKNREVKTLLDAGMDSLGGLEKIFEELVNSTTNVMKIQLNRHYLLKGKSITLVSLLKTRAKHLKEFRNLMSMVIKMEAS